MYYFIFNIFKTLTEIRKALQTSLRSKMCMALSPVAPLAFAASQIRSALEQAHQVGWFNLAAPFLPSESAGKQTQKQTKYTHTEQNTISAAQIIPYRNVKKIARRW